MKRFLGLLAVIGLALGSLVGLGWSQPAAAAGLSEFAFRSVPVLAEDFRNAAENKLQVPFGEKVDLNNSNIRAFRKYPGMYPTIARKIIENAPYREVEDVFDIPGLSDREKEILNMNLARLMVTDPETALVEGGDRFNNGIYERLR